MEETTTKTESGVDASSEEAKKMTNARENPTTNLMASGGSDGCALLIYAQSVVHATSFHVSHAI